MYTKEELILNKTIDVTVTHVESPFEIYVSKVKQNFSNVSRNNFYSNCTILSHLFTFRLKSVQQGVQKIELSKLLDKLKEYYESSTLTAIISTPREG